MGKGSDVVFAGVREIRLGGGTSERRMEDWHKAALCVMCGLSLPHKIWEMFYKFKPVYQSAEVQRPENGPYLFFVGCVGSVVVAASEAWKERDL
jgi:hypothetical protein